MTTNGTMNGWLKLLGVITGLILSMFALFFTMIKPAVEAAVFEQIRVEAIQRIEADLKNVTWGTDEHNQIISSQAVQETRLEKRLDRIESKLDALIERSR
jgi:hypothetical protein